MISSTLDTIKPIIARLTPVERWELVRWIASETIAHDTITPSTASQASWQARISAEAQTWYARPPEERRPYLGQYVAVLNGQVIDHDADQATLCRRIQKCYPDTPVLVTTAEAQGPREFFIRSPRLEHDAP